MSAGRGMLGLIWAAVRKLPDGEACLRSAISRLNDCDCTNQSFVGQPEYSSTKLLDQRQLRELADEFRRRAKLPRASAQPRGPKGGKPRRSAVADEPARVSYLASRGELDYLEYLFDLVDWSEEARTSFTLRQTKGAGATTHATVNAVVAPLERMLRARGFTCTEQGRSKHWAAPEAHHAHAQEDEQREADHPPTRSDRS